MNWRQFYKIKYLIKQKIKEKNLLESNYKI